MTKNNQNKNIFNNPRPIQLHIIDTVGGKNYKYKTILNLYNTSIYRKFNCLNKINYEVKRPIIKSSTYSSHRLIINSIKFNCKRLKIIKNENKNFRKKNM